MFYAVIYRAKISKRKHKINRILFDKPNTFMNFLYGKNNHNKKRIRENVIFKKFLKKEEGEEWLKNNNLNFIKKLSKVKSDTLYFDSGTGRGIGTEARVTNSEGRSACRKFKHANKLVLTENLNFLFADKTNNYGELAAMYIALSIAIENNIKKIAGDSELILKYWSVGVFNEKKLPKETIKLIKATTKLRIKFEENFGEVFYISGDINPADLGFHKRRR